MSLWTVLYEHRNTFQPGLDYFVKLLCLPHQIYKVKGENFVFQQINQTGVCCIKVVYYQRFGLKAFFDTYDMPYRITLNILNNIVYRNLLYPIVTKDGVTGNYVIFGRKTFLGWKM